MTKLQDKCRPYLNEEIQKCLSCYFLYISIKIKEEMEEPINLQLKLCKSCIGVTNIVSTRYQHLKIDTEV